MSGQVSASDQSPSQDTIVASGRWAFFGLLIGAAVWLVVAGVLGLIASVKMHSPNLLADCAWFSYGRLRAAANGAFNFGFATQAAIAAALWLAAVLGRATVRLPAICLIAGKLWNIGVMLGVIGVLYGDSTGQEWLEFPRYSVGVLLVACVGLCLPVFVTFHNRSVRELYPSLWFVVAGLFWFAWLLSTAALLLHFSPVRGILQATVQGWFVNGFVSVWLLPIAIAILLFLRPVLSGGAIPSRATLLLGFWSLAFVGPWGGIPAGTPLPAWVGAVSTSISSLMLIPVLAIFLSVGGMKRSETLDAFGVISWKLADFSFLALVLYGVLATANTFAPVYHVTQFTFITTALQSLAVYGVAGTALLAAAFQIVPRLAPTCDLCAKVARVQSGLVRAGVAVFVISMLAAGLAQGLKLANPEVAFAEVTAASKMWFRLSTLGELLLLLGGLVFLTYLTVSLVRALRAEYAACEWCHPATKPAEVAP